MSVSLSPDRKSTNSELKTTYYFMCLNTELSRFLLFCILALAVFVCKIFSQIVQKWNLCFSRTRNKTYKHKIDAIVLARPSLLLSIVLSPPILSIRGLLKSLMTNVPWRKWSFTKVNFILLPSWSAILLYTCAKA